MSEEVPSVASDAQIGTEPSQAAQAPQPVSNDSTTEPAHAAQHPLLAALEYTLTVGQAQQRFAELRRHVPKERTIQNYCQQGDIAAQKIRTTYGSEWIINAHSLEAFIFREPEMPSDASGARDAITTAHAAHEPEQTIGHLEE
jgi:hypothetical protein